MGKAFYFVGHILFLSPEIRFWADELANPVQDGSSEHDSERNVEPVPHRENHTLKASPRSHPSAVPYRAARYQVTTDQFNVYVGAMREHFGILLNCYNRPSGVVFRRQQNAAWRRVACVSDLSRWATLGKVLEVCPVQTDIIHFPQIENDMALNEQDRAWIREQIDSAFKRRNVWQKIRDWLPVTAMVAITIFALNQWTTYVEFRTKTNDRLDTIEKGVGTIENRLGTIEKTLAGIQSDLSKQRLINHAGLPLSEFKATLPDLSAAIASAKQEKVKVALKIVEDLQAKLTASANAPSFWPAAADFISYRSQIVSRDVQSLMAADLPNCTDRDPTPMELIVSDEEAMHGKAGDVANLPDLLNEKDKSKTHIKSAVYQNCRFTLDSPEETAQIPNLGEQRSYILTFRHCQIIYRGGPVTLLTPHPKPTAITGKSHKRSDVYMFVGQTVHFENCLFVFAISSTPPADGQVLTEQILMQNGNNLTVKFQQG